MIRLFNCYVPRKTIMLFLLEAVLMTLAVPIAAALRFSGDYSFLRDTVSDPFFSIQALIVTAVFQACFFLTEVYEFRFVRPRIEEIARVGQAVGAGAMCLAIIYFICPALMPGRGVFLYSALLVLCLICLSRMSMYARFRGSRRYGPWRTLVVGEGPLARMTLRELSCRNDLDFRIEGVIAQTARAGRRISQFDGYPVLGDTSDLFRVVEEYEISQIIVAADYGREHLPALATLRIGGVRVYDAVSLLADITGRVWIDFVRPDWFIFSDGFHRSRFTAALKRLSDVILAGGALLVCSPVMAVVALLVRLDSRGPCLYRQTRVGLRGRPFELLKFRSMAVDAEAEGRAQWASREDPRITRVGRYLRKFRLDELPQFLNIVRGDMSFVGPRPERPVFVEQLRDIVPYYDERHTVRPGLTGWAQVRFTYTSSIEDSRRKLEYDLYYLKQMSLAFDIAVILYTIRVVLFGWEWGSETVRDAIRQESAIGVREAIPSSDPTLCR